MRRIVMALTLAGLMTVVTGCSVVWLATGVVAGGAAVGLYTSGAEEVMGYTLAQVKPVSVAMLEEVGDGVIEEVEEDATFVKYEGRLEDGATVTVKLSALSESATRVKIWVGITGDRSRAQLLLAKMRKRLKALQRAGPAAVNLETRD